MTPLLRHLAALPVVFFAAQTIAGEPLSESMQSSVQALCTTMRACTLAQVESDKPLTAAMQKMIDQMSDEACQAMHASFSAMPEDVALKLQAQACLDSMSSLSCGSLEALGSGTTPACKVFEKLSQHYQ